MKLNIRLVAFLPLLLVGLRGQVMVPAGSIEVEPEFNFTGGTSPRIFPFSKTGDFVYTPDPVHTVNGDVETARAELSLHTYPIPSIHVGGQVSVTTTGDDHSVGVNTVNEVYEQYFFSISGPTQFVPVQINVTGDITGSGTGSHAGAFGDASFQISEIPGQFSLIRATHVDTFAPLRDTPDVVGNHGSFAESGVYRLKTNSWFSVFMVAYAAVEVIGPGEARMSVDVDPTFRIALDAPDAALYQFSFSEGFGNGDGGGGGGGGGGGLSPVPEPGFYGMAGAASLGFMAFIRARSKRNGPQVTAE